MYKAVLSFIAVLETVRGQTTQVGQCTWNAGAPLPINAEVVGCVIPPCKLPQLQNVVLNLVFEAPKNVKSMRTTADVGLTLGSMTLPSFPYGLKENAIACNFLMNTYCPLQKGEIVQYQLAMYIEDFFAVGVSATLEFQVLDEADSSSIVCVRVPILIVDAVDSATKTILDAPHINSTSYT